MGDLDRPNVGYEALLALRAQGYEYWLMKTEGGYNFIYADVGPIRRYYAQSTSDRMVVYGYWTSYDDIQEWVRLQQPIVPPPETPPTPPETPETPPSQVTISFLPWLAIPVGLIITYVAYRWLKK